MRTLTVTGQLAITSGGQTGVVAGYCRVSTDSDDQANALVVQVDAVKRTGVDVLIQDVMSGGKADRPGYLKLKQLIATKQLDKHTSLSHAGPLLGYANVNREPLQQCAARGEGEGGAGGGGHA